MDQITVSPFLVEWMRSPGEVWSVLRDCGKTGKRAVPSRSPVITVLRGDCWVGGEMDQALGPWEWIPIRNYHCTTPIYNPTEGWTHKNCNQPWIAIALCRPIANSVVGNIRSMSFTLLPAAMLFTKQSFRSPVQSGLVQLILMQSNCFRMNWQRSIIAMAGGTAGRRCHLIQSNQFWLRRNFTTWTEFLLHQPPPDHPRTDPVKHRYPEPELEYRRSCVIFKVWKEIFTMVVLHIILWYFITEDCFLPAKLISPYMGSSSNIVITSEFYTGPEVIMLPN